MNKGEWAITTSGNGRGVVSYTYNEKDSMTIMTFIDADRKVTWVGGVQTQFLNPYTPTESEVELYITDRLQR